jgi:hypothetical protein
MKILYRVKLVNCILEAYQENLLASSSTAKEVSARIDLLQAAQFIADRNHSELLCLLWF